MHKKQTKEIASKVRKKRIWIAAVLINCYVTGLYLDIAC